MENYIQFAHFVPSPCDQRQFWSLSTIAGAVRLRGVMMTRERTRSGALIQFSGEETSLGMRGPPHACDNPRTDLDPFYLVIAPHPLLNANGEPAPMEMHVEASGDQRVYSHVPSQTSLRLIVDSVTFNMFDDNNAKLEVGSWQALYRGFTDDTVLEQRLASGGNMDTDADADADAEGYGRS